MSIQHGRTKSVANTSKNIGKSLDKEDEGMLCANGENFNKTQCMVSMLSALQLSI
jgi:hypothetical protein